MIPVDSATGQKAKRPQVGQFTSTVPANAPTHRKPDFPCALGAIAIGESWSRLYSCRPLLPRTLPKLQCLLTTGPSVFKASSTLANARAKNALQGYGPAQYQTFLAGSVNFFYLHLQSLEVFHVPREGGSRLKAASIVKLVNLSQIWAYKPFTHWHFALCFTVLTPPVCPVSPLFLSPLAVAKAWMAASLSGNTGRRHVEGLQ